MKNKLVFIRTLIMTIMVMLLAWDIMLRFIRHTATFPHRDLLLTGALLWIVSVVFPEQNDDYWVGQL